MTDFLFTPKGILVTVLIAISWLLKPWQRQPDDKIVRCYEGFVLASISAFSLSILFNLKNAQWLLSARLNQFITIFLLLGLVCIFFIFQLLHGKIKNQFHEVTAEEEIHIEQERDRTFFARFPYINRIPLFRYLVRWIDREGWFFGIGFLILLGIGIFLRFWNLGGELFYHDELQQYQTVQGLIHKGELGIYNPIKDAVVEPYYRAAILSKMAFYLVQIFGESAFIIRFPVALAGSLLIVVFYLGLKRLFNKQVAFLGAFLVTFNPYLIYLSRFFRDYSFSILFFSIAAIALGVAISKTKKCGLPFDGWPRIVGFSFLALFISQKFGNTQTVLLLFIFLLSVILFFAKSLWKFYKQHFWIASCTMLLILILFFSNHLPFIDFRGLSHMIQTHLTPRFFSSQYSGYYLNYLFAFNFNWVFIFFSGFLFLYSLFLKRVVLTYFIFIVWIGYYFVAYLGDRYEDFRYIAFLIPIAIILVAYIFHFLWQFSKIFQKHLFGSLLRMIVTLLIVLTPIYQLGSDKLLTSFTAHKAQAFWAANEGSAYIHRRAVAPEYKKTFSYLNNLIEDDDIIIFHGGEYIYLKNYKGDAAYFIPRYSKKARFIADIGEEIVREISFTDLLKTKKTVWFVGTYVHLMDSDVIQTLLQEPFENIGEKIGIKKYDYNEWYADKPVTWPTIVRRPAQN